MLSTVVELLVVIQVLAVPLILLLFYLDGMVVGKITPPAALYVGYVVLVSPSTITLVAVGIAAVLASTLGQLTIYRGFNEESPEFVGIRRTVPYVDRIPRIVKRRVGDRRMEFVTRLFDRYGGIGIAMTNAIPGIRSLMAIPAGLSEYPAGRFVAFSIVGNVAYVIIVTAAAKGFVQIAGITPGV